MPQVKFLPSGKVSAIVSDGKVKILSHALRGKVPIRYGCAACVCGTCAVKIIAGQEALTQMLPDEQKLLQRMQLPIDGTIRLSCQAKTQSEIEVIVDLDFQDTYSPDQGS